MKPQYGKCARPSIAVIAVLLAGCVARPTWRGDEATAFDILNQSTLTLLRLDRSAMGPAFDSAMHQACAVFVFPGSDTGVPMSPTARGDGVLLARDRSSGHWSGPVFYTLRGRPSDAAGRGARHGRVVAVGCDAWHRFYADAEAGPGNGSVASPSDPAALADMTAWSLSADRGDPVSLDGTALQPLPLLSLAYYQAPASLRSVMVDRSIRNDASAEILYAIEKLAS